MEGTATHQRVGFEVCGIRVVVTRTTQEMAGGFAYSARLVRDRDVAHGRLVRHGNACCLEVDAAPAWLHELCSSCSPGRCASVTDGDTLWLEVPPLVRAELLLPWLERHLHERRLAARTA
jgi:hypothetical protein